MKPGKRWEVELFLCSCCLIGTSKVLKVTALYLYNICTSKWITLFTKVLLWNICSIVYIERICTTNFFWYLYNKLLDPMSNYYI